MDMYVTISWPRHMEELSLTLSLTLFLFLFPFQPDSTQEDTRPPKPLRQRRTRSIEDLSQVGLEVHVRVCSIHVHDIVCECFIENLHDKPLPKASDVSIHAMYYINMMHYISMMSYTILHSTVML